MDKKTIAAYKRMGIKVSLGTPEQAAKLPALIYLRSEHKGSSNDTPEKPEKDTKKK